MQGANIYLNNIKKIKEINNEKIPFDASKDELYEYFIKRVQKKRQIILENDQIINSLIYSLDKKKNLTAKEKNMVMNFINVLLHHDCDFDYGILYHLYFILYQDAIKDNNLNEILRLNYYYAHYEYMIIGKHDLYYQFQSFRNANNYIDVFPLLNDDGKNYLLKNLVSQVLDHHFDYNARMELIGFIENKQKMYPSNNVDYNQYLIFIYKQNLELLDLVRKKDDEHQAIDTKILHLIEVSINYLYQNLEYISHLGYNFRLILESSYYTLQFHQGKIDIDELLLKLSKLMVIKEEYTLKEKSFIHFKLNSIIVDYCRIYKKMDSQQLYVYSKKYLRQALEFYREISENHINSFLDFDINNDILSFINALAYFVYLDTFQELLLSFYRICDFVTYVHSCFVGEIAKRIINQLISKNPSFLLGVENYQTINKIRGHRQQLTILINNMAIFHDVGRICLVDLKLFYYRHPTDLENAMLNIHPTLGYNLMKKSTCPQAILDGILFHHDWYDGNNNSRLCTSSSKPLVDIIRVANDLDNQCDNALNPYGLGKPYDEVIAKMRLLKNREYSQEVIELFDDEHFYQEIKELMTSNKKDIIYRELNAKL